MKNILTKTDILKLYSYLIQVDKASLTAIQEQVGIKYSLAGRTVDELIKLGILDNNMTVDKVKIELLKTK